ncbi:MAG: hypothetical protein H8F28_13940 [Fibrella sp.]|nr:hypothetical protein [Armatimonadota bacterium]
MRLLGFCFSAKTVVTATTLLLSCGALPLLSGCGGDNGSGTPFVVGEWQQESLTLTDGRLARCSDGDLPPWESLECNAGRFFLRADGSYERIGFDHAESGTWRLDSGDVLVTRASRQNTERREQASRGENGRMILQISGDNGTSDTAVWQRQ